MPREQAVVIGEAELTLLHDLGCELARDLACLHDSELQVRVHDAFEKVQDLPFEKQIIVRSKSIEEALAVARKIVTHLEELQSGKTLSQAVDEELGRLRQAIVGSLDGLFKYVEPEPQKDIELEANPSPPLECGGCLRSTICKRFKDRTRCNDYQPLSGQPAFIQAAELLNGGKDVVVSVPPKRKTNPRTAWPKPPSGCDFAVESKNEELLGFFPDKPAANKFFEKNPKAWAIWRVSDWVKLSMRAKSP